MEERQRKNLPYAVNLICLCDEWECCGSDGGTWVVRCQFCYQTWPCEDYIANHSDAEIRRTKRYTNARENCPWPEVEDSRYDYMDRFDKWCNPAS